jgi:hypothetical protein
VCFIILLESGFIESERLVKNIHTIEIIQLLCLKSSTPWDWCVKIGRRR